MPTVEGTIKAPDGTAATGVVEFKLAGEDGKPLGVGDLPGSDYMVEGPSPVTLVDGSYSIVLPSNDDILPAGTRWSRTHKKSGTQLLYVTPTPSVQREEDIRADPPGSLASAALDTHIDDLDAHGNGRRLWVARKTDATFATAVTSPIPVTGWNRAATVPAGDWMVEASCEAFASGATDGGTLGVWVDLPITAIARTSNVVTATLASGHGVLVGADVFADLTDNTFDGRFLVTAVPASNQVRWAQTAANDPDGGTGTLSVRLGVNASFRNAGTIRALAHIPDVWWAPTEGVAYTMQPRFNASVGTVTLLSGPFFGLPGQGVMTAETR